MKVFGLALSVMIGLVVSGVASGQPPDHFELLQNEPNPFCAQGEGGQTEIRFSLPLRARVTMEVWNPDTSVVRRTLTDGVMEAGYYTLYWDGRDDSGVLLPAGAYPYAMTASDPDGVEILFDGMLVATIEGPQAAEPSTWGRIKSMRRCLDVKPAEI